MRDETIAIHGGYRGRKYTCGSGSHIPDGRPRDFIGADHAWPCSICRDSKSSTTTGSTIRRSMCWRKQDCRPRGRSGRAWLSPPGLPLCATRLLISRPLGLTYCLPRPSCARTTFTLFAHIILPRGRRQSPVRCRRPTGSPRALIDDSTAAVFCRIHRKSGGQHRRPARCHRDGACSRCPGLVDNTVATPILLKPIEHGADVVVQSLTKFVGGHGTTLGGLIVDGGRFRWAEQADRFPMFSRPEPSFHGVVYASEYPESAYIVRCRTVGMRNGGATPVAFQRISTPARVGDAGDSPRPPRRERRSRRPLARIGPYCVVGQLVRIPGHCSRRFSRSPLWWPLPLYPHFRGCWRLPGGHQASSTG